MHRFRVRALPLIVGLSFWGGCVADGGEAVSRGSPGVAVERIDTLVTTGSGLVGGLTDLEVGADGTLFVLDGRNTRVHALDPDQGHQLSFLTEGEGPTEVRRPVAIRRGHGDTLWVADPGNGRVQAYSPDGEHLGSHSLGPWGSYPLHIGPDGTVVAGSAGTDSAMAASFDRSGVRVETFGTAPSPMAPGTVLRMGEIREQIISGETPDLFRNTAWPAVTAHGAVWLDISADAVLERYPVGGGRPVRIELQEPELPEIRREWRQRHSDPDLRGVMPLRYVRDIYDADGLLWVLLNQPPDTPTVILTFDDAGERVGRLDIAEVAGASVMAADPGRDRLFLGIEDLAQVVMIELEDGR